MLMTPAGRAIWTMPAKDENGTEIFRTDRFRFLHYDIVFYIMKLFSNFVKHKSLSVSVGFTTIFILFLYFLVAKI